MAYHYLWLEASYVFGALDCQLAARRAGPLAGGADHPRNSDPQFPRGPAGHHRDRGSEHHHRADSAIHRVADHLSYPGPVPLGSECLPPETGVMFTPGFRIVGFLNALLGSLVLTVLDIVLHRVVWTL